MTDMEQRAYEWAEKQYEEGASYNLRYLAKTLAAFAETVNADDWIAVDAAILPPADWPFDVTLLHAPTQSRWVDHCAHRQGVWFYCDVLGQEIGYLGKDDEVLAYCAIRNPYSPDPAAEIERVGEAENLTIASEGE